MMELLRTFMLLSLRASIKDGMIFVGSSSRSAKVRAAEILSRPCPDFRSPISSAVGFSLAQPAEANKASNRPQRIAQGLCLETNRELLMCTSEIPQIGKG